MRELGAVDETSQWQGKQVFSRITCKVSNFIVTQPHDLVCCINECEEMMGYIEDAIGTPVASVEDILLVAEKRKWRQ